MEAKTNMPKPSRPEKMPRHEPGIMPESEPIIDDKEGELPIPPVIPKHSPEKFPGKDNLDYVKRHVDP